MKLLFSLIALCLSLSAYSQQPDTDYIRVQETVKSYFKGWKDKDTKLLTDIFHPDSKLKFVNREGAYQEVAIDQHIRDITAADNQFLPPHVMTVTAINVFADGAHAQVQLRFRNFEVADFFSLLKINEEWTIVNKVSVSRTLPESVSRD